MIQQFPITGDNKLMKPDYVKWPDILKVYHTTYGPLAFSQVYKDFNLTPQDRDAIRKIKGKLASAFES
jgi:hypothetical protein